MCNAKYFLYHLGGKPCLQTKPLRIGHNLLKYPRHSAGTLFITMGADFYHHYHPEPVAELLFFIFL